MGSSERESEGQRVKSEGSNGKRQRPPNGDVSSCPQARYWTKMVRYPSEKVFDRMQGGGDGRNSPRGFHNFADQNSGSHLAQSVEPAAGECIPCDLDRVEPLEACFLCACIRLDVGI